MDILIGNICSVLATVADSLSSTQKTPKRILLLQTLSQVIYFISGIVLKGYSAAVQSAVSVFRYLLAIGKNVPKWLEWIFILLGVVLGFWFNNRGVFGWLPIIGTLQYSILMSYIKESGTALKLSFMVMVLMYTTFNFAILNVVGGISNLVVVATTVAALIREKKAKKA